MASVSLVTSSGISSVATPRKTRTASLYTYAGLFSSPHPVNWAGTTAALSRVPWIPKAGTPLMQTDREGKPTNQLNPVWDKCLRWLFEDALGGITAPTPAQIHEAVVTTQVAVATTSNYVDQVASYTAGVAATVDASTEVAVSNGLTGAVSIPPTPTAPERPEPHTF